MGLVEHIHPYLAQVDYRDPINKFSFIGLSIVVLGILYILSAAVFWSLSATYRGLTKNKKVYWNMSIVRAIFGFHCTVFGAWAIFCDNELLENPGISTNSTSYYAILTGTGFFFFECGSLVVSGMYKNITIMLSVHHWYSLFGFCLMASCDVGHYFGLIFLLLEMSAPYSGFCWILIKAGKGHTLLWKANQFLLVHIFHIRSLLDCYLCYQAYKNVDKLLASVSIFSIAVLVIAVILFTFMMTPYWLFKRTQQMFTPVDWNFKELENQEEMNGHCKKDS